MILDTVYHYSFIACSGVLAGIRPCGIIVLLSELFVAESKTQVYACLHNYFVANPEASKTIG